MSKTSQSDSLDFNRIRKARKQKGYTFGTF